MLPTKTTTRARGHRPPQGDPVIDRALSLLAAFDARRPRLSLAELSRSSGIPMSSTLRLANRLVSWGALERADDGMFTIGLRLYEIASLCPRGHGVAQAALPFMGDLAEATHQHVLLAVRDGHEALLVERLSSRTAMPILYRVGGRLPLHSTGVGLVLLAYAEADFQEAYLGQDLMHEPERVPADATALRRTLAQVRRERAITFRRTVPQALVAVASPVFGSDDSIAAALSVVVPDQHIDPHRLIPALQTAARAISRSLGAHRAISTSAAQVDR